MRIDLFLGVALICAVLVGCNSPEEQHKLDVQTCSGYGFQPGSPELANCMMQTAQQRQADQAASARQQALNNTIAQQAQKDRDAQAAAQSARDSAAREADVQRMMNSPSPSFIPADAVTTPAVATTAIPSIDTSNMNCTTTTNGNASTTNCTSK
jgi:hypothetical protein